MSGCVGVNSKAQELIGGWVGVNGKARRIVGGWVGVNGKARPIWSASGWRREDDIPYNFYQGVAVVYQGKVHLIGGAESQTFHYSWDGTNWTQESTLPHNCILTGAISWKGKLYIFGSNTSRTYDVRAVYSWDGYQWTQEADIPITFHGINRTHIWGGDIHLIGSDYDRYSMWAYDSVFDGSQWIRNTTGVSFYSTVLFNDVIYMLGDTGSGGNKWAIYDGSSVTPSADWGNLPYAFIRGFALRYGDKIHMLGSNYAHGVNDYRKNHYVFDGTNFTKKSVMPYNFYYAPAVVYKNRIHIFGGDNNRTEHWSYGEKTKAIWSVYYPNSEVSQPCVVETNNGRRSPVEKVNSGDAIVFIANNSRGSQEGGNWFSAVSIATTQDAAILSAPTQGTVTRQYTIDGETYYLSWQSTNSRYGGGTTFQNPLGIPVFDLFISDPYSAPSQAKVEEIIDMLGIQHG